VENAGPRLTVSFDHGTGRKSDQTQIIAENRRARRELRRDDLEVGVRFLKGSEVQIPTRWPVLNIAEKLRDGGRGWRVWLVNGLYRALRCSQNWGHYERRRRKYGWSRRRTLEALENATKRDA